MENKEKWKIKNLGEKVMKKKEQGKGEIKKKWKIKEKNRMRPMGAEHLTCWVWSFYPTAGTHSFSVLCSHVNIYVNIYILFF